MAPKTFNHRDLKDDNIMCDINTNDPLNPELRIIDFGLSCMTINGVNLTCGLLSNKMCCHTSRDLAQMLHIIFKHTIHN